MRREPEIRRSGGHVLLIFLLVTVGVVVGSTTADSPSRQPSSLVFHDLSAMTRWQLGRMHARGAMGQTGSIMVTELPPGVKTFPHHHHQEQMMLGLSGQMRYLMGDTPYPLSRLTAAIAVTNVHHGNINDSAEPASCVEFQPVLRPDWFPPHPRRPREGTPEPLPIPAGRKVTETFVATSDGWTTQRGARSKSLNGETAGVTVWELAAGSGPVDLTSGRAAERFVYVIDGDVAIADGASVRNVSREMLIIIAPAARGVRVSAPRRSGATIAVFEALKP